MNTVKLTKKEAKARKESWNKALREGRIVKFGLTMRECPTVEAAARLVDELAPNASIVRVP